jgi:hypothetical protein
MDADAYNQHTCFCGHQYVFVCTCHDTGPKGVVIRDTVNVVVNPGQMNLSYQIIG